MNGKQATKIIKYIVLPGVIPRMRALFASGFGHIAFLMAFIYNGVRILPANHPYLKPENIGKFGVRHVIAEAANHLQLRRNNIDQIAIFGVTLVGIFLLFAQFAMLIYGFLIGPALAAGGVTGTSMFNTPNPENDIAFTLMDKVFGVPGFFCNDAGLCTNVQADLPYPFHTALHALLQFYSTGLLIVGVLIFLYFVVVVVAETATSGTPFGKRFQNVWVPIRLIVAIGLLLPLNYGLNTGQYITLFAAKTGSGLATNGWLRFNDAVDSANIFEQGTGNPSGEKESLLAIPNAPDVAPLVQFMTTVHACAYAYWHQTPGRAENLNEPKPPSAQFNIKPYFVKHPMPWMSNTEQVLEITESTTIDDGLDFYGNGDIIIRFGRADENDESLEKYKGRVEPTCGEVRVPITALRNGPARVMQERYFDFVKLMWFNADVAGEDGSVETDLLVYMPRRYMAVKMKDLREGETLLQCTADYGCSEDVLPSCSGDPAPCEDQVPDTTVRQKLVNDYQVLLNSKIVEAWESYNPADSAMHDEIRSRGWGGAGIWYNTISEINGAFTTAVFNIPLVESFPKVMEEAREERRKNDSDPSGIDQFAPNLSNGQPIKFEGGSDARAIAKQLHSFFVFWNHDDQNQASSDKTVTGNIFEDSMNAILGLNGLFDLRGKNAHIHPLAQLAAVGKGLVEAAVRNLALSSVAAFMGGVLGILDPHASAALEMASNVLTSVTFIALTAGFVLYYVLPFMPFLYFFFAVGSWIKTIFEAMVGVPLWALAHLRIDGEGLPGEAASNGYFLVFDIFLRPITTLFGFLAAFIVFAAQVRVLNFIWDIVITNLTGYEPDPQIEFLPYLEVPRATVDQFFYTIIYAIIMYMLANASFKLINTIPDNLLRWFGAGVSSFSDIEEDLKGELQRYAAIGGITFGRQLTQGVQGLAKGSGQAVGGVVGDLVGPPPDKGGGG